MRILAIDWSGAQGGGQRKIWLAEVVDRRARRLENGRGRSELMRHLIEMAAGDPELAIGLDFAFAFPLWYLEARGVDSAADVWRLAEAEGEEWLAACEPPFWGRTGRGAARSAGRLYQFRNL